MKSHLLWSAALLVGLGLSGGVAHAEDKAGGKEEAEVKVAIDQVPAPVKATLEREASGQKIETVDKEGDGAKAVYEADVKIDNKNYEIRVAEDGTLISKALDTEDEGGKKGDGKKDEEKKD